MRISDWSSDVCSSDLALRLDQGEWALVVDELGKPGGWIDVTGVERVRAGKSLDSSVSAGGSLFTPDGDLRQALDAAIRSEERRVGKECVSKCRSRLSPYH